MDFIVDFIVLR